MKRLIFIGCLFLGLNAFSADWYVRPSAAGADNGTDWSNAWNITSLNSHWSSVGAGDTVWMAGGSYSTSIVPTKSGSAGNLIYIKRVLSSDAVPTAAAGWSASFDSPVTNHPASASAINFTTSANGSYVYVDGRTNYGIVLITDDFNPESGGCVSFGGYGPSNITFAHIDMAGPGGSHTFVNNQGVFTIGYNVGGLGTSGITVSNCAIHGSPCLMFLRACTGVTVEHCKFYDNHTANEGEGGAVHPNLFDCFSTTNLTFRYNDVSDWPVEGFMMWGNCGTFWVYGNVFHDPYPLYNVSTVIWPANTSSSQTNQGPIYFYNNTFIQTDVTSTQGAGQTLPFASGSQIRNNLYWTNQNNDAWNAGSTVADRDYEFAGGTAVGAHSISGGSNPFVNYSGKDFHIVGTVGATYPKDKGVSLDSMYNSDLDGNTRGADGSWDIGAYQYIGATYYIDYTAANDSANGITTSTPWKRCPGMVGFDGSYSHSAGDRFIFKGGVTWSNASLPLSVGYSGESGSWDYYGVDPTYFTGASWSRPIFDGGEVSRTLIYMGTISYVTMDNLDLRGVMATNNYGDCSVKMDYATYVTFTNLWVHKWTHDAGMTTDGQVGGIYHYFGSPNTGVTVTHCDIGNPDGDGNSGTCVYFVDTVSFSKIHDAPEGILHGGRIVNDNEFYNIVSSFDGSQHPNYTFIDNFGSDGYFYNNWMHLDTGDAMFLYLVGFDRASANWWVYNNLFDGNNPSVPTITVDTDNHACAMSVYLYNNTIIQHSSGTFVTASRSSGSYALLENRNNHWIGGGPSSGSFGTVINGNNYTNSNVSNAGTYGYTDVNYYAPAGGSVPTVGAGTNLTGLGLPGLTSDTSLGGNQTPISRPSSGAWDIGAYQYSTGETNAPGTNAVLHYDLGGITSGGFSL